MRCGIMGGTFNPVHLGHLRAAEEVAESLHLSKVIFVPAAKPPHKPEEEIAPFRDRWRMLELSLENNPGFSLSDLEYQRPGKSYSVETLGELQSQFGREMELYFVVGLDAFLDLPTWKRYLDLFSLCRFIVVARPGYSAASLKNMLQTHVSERYSYDVRLQGFTHPERHTVYYREVTLLDISSSRIRQLLARGRSVRYLLPPEVEAYIYRRGLYGSRRPVSDSWTKASWDRES